MKKLIIIAIIAIFSTITVHAQFWQTDPSQGKYFQRIKVINSLIIPVGDTSANQSTIDSIGSIMMHDNDMYILKNVSGTRYWQKIATGSGSTLVRDSVQQLSILPGKEEAVVVVKDTLRGGVFYWAASGYTADNGVVFAAPSGYWIRRYDRATGINVRWYGPANNVVTDDISKIQSAVNRAAADSVGYVRMNGLRMLIGSAIQLPSNITLDATGSYIELKKASNEDFVRNKDLVNGNNNIKVFGGHWSGNGWTQTRTIAGTVSASNFCYGFFFHKVEDLEIGNMQIDSTRSWAIAVMIGNRVHVHDVYVQQSPFDVNGANPGGVGRNGDGVTMNASNAVVENIRGYTNDDMIAFAAGGAEFQGGTTPFERLDYKNVVARNIFPENMLDSIPTYRAVGVYTFQRHRLDNITIENVAGETTAGLVYFSDPFNDKAYFSNVNIKNIAGTTKKLASAPVSFSTFGLIGTNAAEIDNITVDGIRRIETVTTSPVAATFRFRDSTRINNISISNVYVSHKNIAGTLIQDDGTAKNINLSNITMIDTNNIVGQYLYSRAATPFTTDSVFIRGSSVNVTVDGNANKPIVRSGMKISYSGATPLMDDTLNFSARDGDIISAKNIGFTYYYAGKWQQTNGFMKETTTGSYNFNNANGTTGFFMTGNTNTPTGVAYHGLTIPHAATFASQFALRNNAFWYRSLEAGTWQPWLQVADRTFTAATYQPIITPGTTAQYYRGDKTFQNLNVAAVSGMQDSLNAGTLQRTTDRGNVTNNTVVLSGMNKLTAPPGTSSLLHSIIDHSFNMFNTNADGSVNSTIQLGDGKLDITSNSDNYIRSNAGEFDLRAVTPDGNATLQFNSSAAGASQFDLWKADDTYQYGIFSDLNNRGVGFAVEVAGYALPGFPHQSVNLIAEKDSTAVRFISGTGGNSSLIKTNNSFRFNYDNSSNPIGLQMATVLNEVKNNFFKDGRVSGSNAVNSNEFTTLGQARSLGDYIRNSNTTEQSGSGFWVSGSALSSSQFQVRRDGLATVNGGFSLYNAAQTRGVIQQLNENTNPGLSTWIHNGTSWLKRFELFADGGFQFPNIISATAAGIISIPSEVRALQVATAAAPNSGGFLMQNTANQLRWVNRTTNTETGTDYLGADWILERRNNAGAGASTVIFASRLNGNVGIGNTNPSQKLDVTGNIAASGAILTGGIVANLRIITASYSLTGSDYTIINRATTGTPTLTLPTATGNAGRIYFLSDEAGTPQMMTISPGIVYKGTTYTTLNNPFFINGPRALIQSDGTNWVILTN